ncbi:hypothetical protein [Streptomyces sp. NPDC047315]|uniref:hypothetical protein n=1 Tax=Streptomyces sp. NPDC047315 TaxID=3155142 RepID=UPI003404EAC3
MGRQTWGKTVSALTLATITVSVSACGSSDDAADAKPSAEAKVTVEAASKTFRAAVEKFGTDGGCLQKEPETCWDQMQALMEPARDLRKAMNAEKSVGPDFWTGAYALINGMEKGIGVGKDQGAAGGVTALTNRDDVFGSAHDLVDWLDAHPIK